MGKFYECLGVDPKSSKDDIKKAYKRLAVQLHPDKGGDPEKFKELSAAYQVLSDEEQRARYDAVGDAGWASGAGGGQGGGPGFDPNSIFEQFFGGGGPFGGGGGRGQHAPPRRKCPDHRHAMQISLADAFHGVKRTLRAAVKTYCSSCRESCYACQGVGSVTHVQRMGFFTQMMSKQCDSCKGNGVKCKGCSECEGRGMWNKMHTLDIELPPGVSTGWSRTYVGLGEQACRPEDKSGDLVIEVVVVPDRMFERIGHDLATTIPISFVESMTGKVLQIPMVDGLGSFTVDTAEFGVIKPGETYKIAGKGMPKGANGSMGDLLLTFKITYPSGKLNENQREALKEVFKTVKWV